MLTYASFTRAHPSKPRNGAAYRVIETETGIIAVLANGVDTRPCDWKAADTAVSVAVSALQEDSSESVSVRLEKSIIAANEAVCEIFGVCKGAMSSIGIAIVQESQFWTVIIGDCKIYWYNNAHLKAISSLYSDCFLGEPLQKIEVSTGLLSAGDGLLLTTNSVDTRQQGFQAAFDISFRRADWQDNLLKMIQEYTVEKEAERTVILIKNNK